MTPSTDDPAIPCATPAREACDPCVIVAIRIAAIGFCLLTYAAAYRVGVWIWGG